MLTLSFYFIVTFALNDINLFTAMADSDTKDRFFVMFILIFLFWVDLFILLSWKHIRKLFD